MENNELALLRSKLKSGEYDGADIMAAWIAIDELLTHRATAMEWKWVPMQPTEAMLRAASSGEVHTADVQSGIRRRERTARQYRAMLAAAPAPDDQHA